MINVLFVCHGNICRSPMAEFILKDILHKGLTFDETNETNIANGWTVAATDSATGRVTAVKTNNLVNKAVLADVNSDSIIKLLTG